ncbi:MAG TPA: NFACT family protein, partial [Pyrinomonadaceae bacterium]|nr:NFACT family protein [Pyrinomonadaceae bacterium]
MDEQLLQTVVEEVAPALEGRALGRVFQLARAALAFDFRGADGRYLFVSVEPNRPRLYLFRRTVRELEKQSETPSAFVLALRKHAGGATVARLTKDENERVVRLQLDARDEAGTPRLRALVVQLTGRSSNLFLLDEAGRVLSALRDAHGPGQSVGEPYAPPTRNAPHESVAGSDETQAPTVNVGTDSSNVNAEPSSPGGDVTVRPTKRPRAGAPSGPPREPGAFGSLSEALDDFYRREERERIFDARVAAHRAELRRALERRRKLRRNLERDLAAHGDADEHKRAGDLLLANLANAERRGSVVRLTDYYADDAPTVEFEVEEGRTLTEEAEQRFARYTKARRAAQEIARR